VHHEYFAAVLHKITGLYGTRPGNWRRSRWEYAHFHRSLDESALNKIGIWEDDGAIVGVVNYEGVVGNAFFQIRSGYESLKPEMLRYAEAHLRRVKGDGASSLGILIHDFDTEFERIALAQGYEKPEADDQGDAPTHRSEKTDRPFACLGERPDKMVKTLVPGAGHR